MQKQLQTPYIQVQTQETITLMCQQVHQRAHQKEHMQQKHTEKAIKAPATVDTPMEWIVGL